MRTIRDFFSRAIEEQRWLAQNTWCETCSEADLGLNNPVEYEEAGRILISGECRKCGRTVTSLISDKEIRAASPPAG